MNRYKLLCQSLSPNHKLSIKLIHQITQKSHTQVEFLSLLKTSENYAGENIDTLQKQPATRLGRLGQQLHDR